MKVKTYLTDTVDGVLMFGCLSVTVVNGDKNYLLDRKNDFKLQWFIGLKRLNH